MNTNISIKRDDAIYKEIENFEDYELTQCIAYEMAIRNDGVIYHLNDALKFIELKMDVVISYFTNNFNDLHEEEQRAEYLEFGDTVEQIEYTLKECQLSGEWFENDLFYNNIFYQDKRIHKNIYNFLQLYILKINNDLDMKAEIDKQDDVTLEYDSHNERIEATRITHRDGYIFKSSIIGEKGDCVFYDEEIDESREVTCTQDFKKMIDSSLEGREPIEIENNIIQKFKRPKLRMPSILNTLKYKVELDISSPLDELIAYITHIKIDLEKNKNILKSPIELVDELQKADGKHTQKIPKAIKYADWFYIYDCYKILKNGDKSDEIVFGEIDLQLMEHYGIEDKDYYYSFETYKKTIMKNMKYLIDNFGYMELITGVNIRG